MSLILTVPHREHRQLYNKLYWSRLQGVGRLVYLLSEVHVVMHNAIIAGQIMVTNVHASKQSVHHSFGDLLVEGPSWQDPCVSKQCCAAWSIHLTCLLRLWFCADISGRTSTNHAVAGRFIKMNATISHHSPRNERDSPMTYHSNGSAAVIVDAAIQVTGRQKLQVCRPIYLDSAL